MQGLDEFIHLFGDVTVLNIVEIVLAGVFLLFVYKQIKKFFQQKIVEQNKRAEAEKVRDQQIKEALDAVHKYPEYRKQSIAIQQKLEAQIDELKEIHKDTTSRLSQLEDRLTQMEEATNRRERNKIRDRLLQNYRYYVSRETNPSQSWTKMESEAFWELFREYEEAGGDGYMHTDVMPAMQLLHVIDQNEK